MPGCSPDQSRQATLSLIHSGSGCLAAGLHLMSWLPVFGSCPTARRVMVAYKTIESGPADPSGVSTSTWRDPAGPNQPENARAVKP